MTMTWVLSLALTCFRVSSVELRPDTVVLEAETKGFPEALEQIGDFRAAAWEHLHSGDPQNEARCLVAAGDTGAALSLLMGQGDSSPLRVRIYIA